MRFVNRNEAQESTSGKVFNSGAGASNSSALGGAKENANVGDLRIKVAVYGSLDAF